MPYIIDGNNLVGCFPDISLDDPDARSRLLYVIRKFQENRKNNVIIVFDGEPDEGVRKQVTSSKFTIVYPDIGNSADDEIKVILSSFNYFKDVVVVTSDRELKTFAKKKGAKTINSIEFYFELKRFSHIYGKKEENQKRIDAKLSETEVDQWMKIFNER
jgi:predicted RNA-binding protein with PIN domain